MERAGDGQASAMERAMVLLAEGRAHATARDLDGEEAAARVGQLAMEAETPGFGFRPSRPDHAAQTDVELTRTPGLDDQLPSARQQIGQLPSLSLRWSPRGHDTLPPRC
jgi:hypothetical protein